MSQNEKLDSQDRFIDYLNDEIEQLREEIKMPGWTNWAILAALASIGWVIILELEKNLFNIEQIYLMFILVSLSYGIARELYDLIKPSNHSNRRIRFFTVNMFFQENRPIIVVNYLQAGITILLLWHFSTQAGNIPYYLSLLRYGIVIFGPLILFAIQNAVRKFTSVSLYIPDPSGNDIPFSIPSASNKKNNKTMNFAAIYSILAIAIGSYVLIAYSSLYFKIFGTSTYLVTFSSLKLTLLVFSIILLLRLLVYSDKTSPTLKELVNIRRDVMFGNIDLDMARKLTEISISGLNKSEIIQREIGNCILTLQSIDTELNKATQKNKVALDLLHESKENEDSESRKTLWETIRDSTLSHFRLARSIYLSDKSLGGGLAAFLRIYGAIEPTNTEFIGAIQKMGELYIEVKKKYDGTIQEWLNLVIQYEGFDESKKWKDIAVKELAADLVESRS